ncbi:MAG: TIGR00730 family Rossman fold protein [Candidatus Competibacterales bacterium]
MKSICVFCGARSGNDPAFGKAATALASLAAERGLTVVYGGGNVGLMGTVADAALAAGGRVVGVIPDFLIARELAHQGLTEQHVVDSMHQRKALMTDLCEAFVALPGGFGTLDELCEALTWAQLDLHHKPIGLLNTMGYFDGLLAFFDHAVQRDFLRAKLRNLVFASPDAEVLLDHLARASSPTHRDPTWLRDRS